MMSLYNLWRFRIVFAATLVLYGAAMGVYGMMHAWNHGTIAFASLVCLMCAATIFPWTRAQRPLRPTDEGPYRHP